SGDMGIGKLNTCISSEFSFDVAANDSIEGCSEVSFAIIQAPLQGAATIDDAGIVSYSLTDSDYVGFDTLLYEVTCESCTSLKDTAMVVMEIINGDLPISIPDRTFSKSCLTDEVITVSLELETTLAQCDSSFITILQLPISGEAEITQEGIFIFNLLNDTFNGTDTLIYEVYCAGCESQLDTASIFIEVDCAEICEDITIQDETFVLEACGNQISDQLIELTLCETVTYNILRQPLQGSFNFDGDNGSFNYTLSNLAFNGIDSVTYEVICVRDCGEKADTATIYFDLTNNSLVLPVITKLITPNSDGFNDFLTIRNIDCYPSHTFKVFNRWGNLIFETTDYANTPDQAWSGQVNKNSGISPGTFVGDGTYFCILELGNGNEISEYVEIRGSNR
ncbi:MAG: gliding motility-associated C-terminal domain-containing protein, partial [Bacteroidota bacterium]